MMAKNDEATKRAARRAETVKACNMLADSMQRQLDEINVGLHGTAETQRGIAAGFKSLDERLYALEKARGMHE